MALNLSGLTNIRTLSGVQIDKVMTKSGVIVWQRATPYYPTFKNTSVWTQHDCTDNAEVPFHVYSDSVAVSARDNEQMTDFATSEYIATFNTNGCNKVRVYARSESSGYGDTGGIEVNDVMQVVPALKTYLYYDIDPNASTFTIKLNSVNASSYYSLDVILYEIYVYYE